MRTFKLERSIVLPRPVDAVFAFFSDPYNLEAITPPWLRFAIRSVSHAPIAEGTRIRYGLRLHGIPIGWTSRIRDWEPPHRFVDEQLRGPYRLWIHEHTFEARGAETLVGDRVRYAPLGGWLVDRLLVRSDLERIFDYRHRQLEKLLGGPAVAQQR